MGIDQEGGVLGRQSGELLGTEPDVIEMFCETGRSGDLAEVA